MHFTMSIHAYIVPECIQDSSSTEATSADPPRKNIQVDTLATYNTVLLFILLLLLYYIISIISAIYCVYCIYFLCLRYCYTRVNVSHICFTSVIILTLSLSHSRIVHTRAWPLLSHEYMHLYMNPVLAICKGIYATLVYLYECLN